MSPQSNAGSLKRFAPAKINLALHVTGRRADGYHLLDSLVVFADCGDTVTVAPALVDAFTISGPQSANIPTDRGNLVLRARDALREAHGGAPVAIHLDKHLPIASGIGGGSSDAAATLQALGTLWKHSLPGPELGKLGLSLGADVPMCLKAQPLRATGIGESLEAVASLPDFAALLVNPGIAVSTSDIFRALTSCENSGLLPFPKSAEPTLWLEWLHANRNDLQPAALTVAPVIGDVLHALSTSGAAFVRMSGSGATCFGLFADLTAANEAAAQLRKQHPDWYIQPTLFKGSEPAT